MTLTPCSFLNVSICLKVENENIDWTHHCTKYEVYWRLYQLTESFSPGKTRRASKNWKLSKVMMMITACHNIPTMTKSHHDGNMSVMNMVGFCRQHIHPTIEDEFWLVCAGQQKFNFYDENLWQICEKSKSQNWEDVTEDGAARSPGTEGDDDMMTIMTTMVIITTTTMLIMVNWPRLNFATNRNLPCLVIFLLAQ